MGIFNKKTWTLKKAGNRKTFVNLNTSEKIVVSDVTPTTGDEITSDQMNDLENRINDAIDSLDSSKQDSATAITTSNIGSQHVAYADSAGSATNATNATQDGNGNNIAQQFTSINASLTNKFNGTVGSGETILDCVVNRAPVGLSFWYTQSAADSPVSGTVSFCIINKATSSGAYSYVYLFSSNISRAYISSTVPSALTWQQLTG